MRFSVIAWDRPGPEGVALRDNLRPAHTESITARFHASEVILGAGFYDDSGVVRGSLVVLELPSRADVDAYLASEPFNTGGLWESIEVRELRLPDMYVERPLPGPA